MDDVYHAGNRCTCLHAQTCAGIPLFAGFFGQHYDHGATAFAKDYHVAASAGVVPSSPLKRGGGPGAVVRVLLDSGATQHCFRTRELLSVVTKSTWSLSGICAAADVQISHSKTLQLGSTTFVCSGVLFSPSLSLDLLSESRMIDEGWRLAADRSFIFHISNPECHVPQLRIGNLYWVDLHVPAFDCACSSFDIAAAVRFNYPEHDRLGHVKLPPRPGLCEACDRVRRATKPVSRTPMDLDHNKGVVSTDLAGPYAKSIGAAKYLQLFYRYDFCEPVPGFCSTKSSSETARNLRATSLPAWGLAP